MQILILSMQIKEHFTRHCYGIDCQECSIVLDNFYQLILYYVQ